MATRVVEIETSRDNYNKAVDIEPKVGLILCHTIEPKVT